MRMLVHMLVIDDQQRSVKVIIEAIYSMIIIVSTLLKMKAAVVACLKYLDMSKLRIFIASCILFDIDIGKG